MKFIKKFSSLLTFVILFLYLIKSFMIILYNTLLPSDRAQSVLADYGTTTKPTLITNNITDVGVASTITVVSYDSHTCVNIEVSVF